MKNGDVPRLFFQYLIGAWGELKIQNLFFLGVGTHHLRPGQHMALHDLFQLAFHDARGQVQDTVEGVQPEIIAVDAARGARAVITDFL
jgi:hypothetical protein